MGNYLNPGNEKFRRMIQSEIYVDKTGMIKYTNSVLDTAQNYVCVSRPRRFGKSMAANMLTAYYSRGCNSKELFGKFEIAKDKDFEKYLNQYNTIFLNMQEFLSRSHNVEELIDRVKKLVIRDLKMEYPEVDYFDDTDLIECMQDIYAQMQYPFVVIIDEWDCIFREYKQDKEAQEKYLDFLRDLLKDKACIYLSYMTGILPIKKYGTHSALNMFDEFSMIAPGPLACYVGFTEQEVKKLCEQYGMDMEEVKNWYDGYSFDGVLSVYSPRSVVNSMRFRKISNYWNQTETFEALQMYIDMNFEHLKDDVLSMIAGESVAVNTESFTNDMATFRTEDDVLTLLIHLGYLAYDQTRGRTFIPNEEIRQEFLAATKRKKWNELLEFEQQSMDLLEATLDMDEAAVAEAIEKIHMGYASVIQYNNENTLSSVLSIAYLSTLQYYFKPARELPTGRGFADFVYLPKPEYFTDYPALVVELKWNKKAETALQQIKDKKYPASIRQYTGNILLVGISYDKKSRKYQCVIETDEK